MQIQVNSNHTMHTGESFERWAVTTLNESLSRFKDDITRIEVHMSDENADKVSGDQKRCMMEARLANREPVAVNHHGATQDEAIRGATHRLIHALDHKYGKLDRHQHRDRETIRKDVIAPE